MHSWTVRQPKLFVTLQKPAVLHPRTGPVEQFYNTVVTSASLIEGPKGTGSKNG